MKVVIYITLLGSIVSASNNQLILSPPYKAEKHPGFKLFREWVEYICMSPRLVECEEDGRPLVFWQDLRYVFYEKVVLNEEGRPRLVRYGEEGHEYNCEDLRCIFGLKVVLDKIWAPPLVKCLRPPREWIEYVRMTPRLVECEEDGKPLISWQHLRYFFHMKVVLNDDGIPHLVKYKEVGHEYNCEDLRHIFGLKVVLGSMWTPQLAKYEKRESCPVCGNLKYAHNEEMVLDQSGTNEAYHITH